MRDVHIFIGVFFLVIGVPALYAICCMDTCQRACWRMYNTEQAKDDRATRNEKRRDKMAPIYGSVV